MAPTTKNGSLFDSSSFMLKKWLVLTKLDEQEVDMGLSCNCFLGRASE